MPAKISSIAVFPVFSLELHQVKRVLPRSLQFFAVAQRHSSNDAEGEEEEDFSVVVAGGGVVGEDEGDEELEEVAQREGHPIVAVYALSDLLPEDQQGYVGNDDHQSSQTDRVYCVENDVDVFTVRRHYHHEGADVHDGSHKKEDFEPNSRRQKPPYDSK
jgi:hypothetical protein